MTFADMAGQTEGLSISPAWELMEQPLFSGREEEKEVGMEVGLFSGVSGTQEPEANQQLLGARICLRDWEFRILKLEPCGEGQGLRWGCAGLREVGALWVGFGEGWESDVLSSDPPHLPQAPLPRRAHCVPELPSSE